MTHDMRFGLQTILWGNAPVSTEDIFRYAKSLGLQGVEVFQHPDRLGPAIEFRRALQATGVVLTGLSSGTLRERIEYCEASGLRPDYLYIDNWDEFIPTALDQGYTVALHPHVYKTRTLIESFALLHCDERLRLILDPAHLIIGGLDPLTAINDHFSRIVAVHLKDWVPWFGRSFHRYAQGFTELGSGIVPLKPFLDRLTALNFRGWAIIEQDAKTSTPEVCVHRSLKWLVDQGYYAKPLPASVTQTNANHQWARNTACHSDSALRLADTVRRAADAPEIFPEAVVQGCAAFAQSSLARLWSYCPSQNMLTLIASYPQTYKPETLKVSESFSGLVIDSHRTTYFDDLTLTMDTRKLRDPDLLTKHQLRSLLSVPIVNRYNPNHVEFVLNLFFSHNVPVTVIDELTDSLELVSDVVAQSAERIISDRCTRVIGAVQEQFATCSNKDLFLHSCLQILVKAIECEAASVFLTNTTGDRMDLAASSSEVEWNVRLPDAKRFYERGTGLVGRVWDDNVEFISYTTDRSVTSEISRDKTSGPVRSVILAPIRDFCASKVLGVMRCSNKINRSETHREPRSFSQEDATVLQALCDAIVPRLLLFRGEEHTRLMLTKLTHELKTPIGGINAQLDFTEAEAEQQRVRFSENWIKEARDNVTLMAGLVENAESAIRTMRQTPVDEPYSQVLLMRDIIIPAMDQMMPQLRRHGLPHKSITYQGLKVIPPLYVKRSAIRQVVYNLLSNSIKYRYRDRSVFSVEIVPEAAAEGYLVHFRDWGPGVDAKEAEVIFSLGVRGSDAHRYDVAGQGYGLYISRQIMRDHGGDLWLSNAHQPTVFTLLFPSKLIWKPNL
jgi:sugar phosphate isomerase/epimerase/signal transduction histidine kinase